MEYGVCCGPDVAAIAAEVGMDFIEMTVAGLLKPQEPEAAFQEVLAEVRAAGVPCRVVNCFIPGSMKITGPDADMAVLQEYVTTAFDRARQAGLEVIVFGSGGARMVPDGFDHGQAWGQVAEFCRMAGPIAEEHGITVVVEPLATRFCNIVTSVAEGGRLVREVDHPAIRLLVDNYHWGLESESTDSIVENGPLLRHVHVATVANRLPPGAEEYDFAPCFQALRQGGYDGRLSIEATMTDPAEQLGPALEIMKTIEDLQ